MHNNNSQTYELVVPWGSGMRSLGPLVSFGDNVYARTWDWPGHIKAYPEDLVFPIAGERERFTDIIYNQSGEEILRVWDYAV